MSWQKDGAWKRREHTEGWNSVTKASEPIFTEGWNLVNNQEMER